MKSASNNYLFYPLIFLLLGFSLQYMISISISAENTELNSFNFNLIVVSFSFFTYSQQVFPFSTIGFSA